jgi:CRISPR/Cas system-associated exonuclease Cas4 (RecB family)
MTSMALLVGSAVHEVLARDFRSRKFGAAREAEPERAVDLMRTAWMNAKKELWRENPKKYPPLFEIYYDRIPDGERLRGYAEKARRAVTTVKSSLLYSRIRSLSPSDLLWVDPVGEGFSEEIVFDLPPYQAISAPDLVIREGERMVIVDWKTGKENEADRTQMEAAAAWAVEKLGAGDQAIEGLLFYSETGQEIRFPIGRPERERVETVIRGEMEAMAACLEDEKNNVPRSEDHFPLRENRAFCRYCEFQEICFGEGGMGNREWEVPS